MSRSGLPKTNAPLCYLIEPSLVQQWQRDAKEIVIYGDVNLATADRYIGSGNVAGQFSGGQQWCTAGFFFQNRLIYLRDGGAAFPGCLPVSSAGDARKRSVVLPLTEDALRLFTAKELQESFSISWLPNGGATCYLRLQLKTSDGKGKVCRIQRTYTEAEMVLVEDLPLICIWPDFRLETVNWQTYYTFEQWPTKTREELIKKPWDELSVKPWSDDEREPASNRDQTLDGRHFQVSYTKNYPEALICSTPYTDLDNHKQDTAYGLLLVNRPELQAPPPAPKMTVGVDFGSTGSDIYQRTGNGDPKPLIFKNRLRKITGFATTQFNMFTRERFIPARDWPADEILSVFQDFGDPKDGSGARMVVQGRPRPLRGRSTRVFHRRSETR